MGEVMPLPDVRKRRLKELETVISTGWGAAVAVGQALREIRDEGLYLEVGASSFDSYCRSRWSIADRTALQYMDAAAVARAIRASHDPIPILTEWVGRELAPILRDGGPERVAEAWTKVSERFKGQRPPTARLVHEVLVEEGFVAPRVTDKVSGGRLNTEILLGQFGEKLVAAENRLNWFFTRDIANRKKIGKSTRTLAVEYADRLDELATQLRTFGEAEA
jgi:hypothetical protein